MPPTTTDAGAETDRSRSRDVDRYRYAAGWLGRPRPPGTGLRQAADLETGAGRVPAARLAGTTRAAARAGARGRAPVPPVAGHVPRRGPRAREGAGGRPAWCGDVRGPLVLVGSLLLLGATVVGSRDGRGRGSVLVPLPPADAGLASPAEPPAGGEVRRRLDDLARQVGEIRATVAALARERAGAPPPGEPPAAQGADGTPPARLSASEPAVVRARRGGRPWSP